MLILTFRHVNFATSFYCYFEDQPWNRPVIIYSPELSLNRQFAKKTPNNLHRQPIRETPLGTINSISVEQFFHLSYDTNRHLWRCSTTRYCYILGVLKNDSLWVFWHWIVVKYTLISSISFLAAHSPWLWRCKQWPIIRDTIWIFWMTLFRGGSCCMFLASIMRAHNSGRRSSKNIIGLPRARLISPHFMLCTTSSWTLSNDPSI